MTDVSQSNDGTTNEAGGNTTADKFKNQIAGFKSQATDKARDYAGQGVTRATDALDEAARFLEDTARTIEDKVGAQYGRYGFTAAESVSRFAEKLRGKEVDELVDDVRDFVRKSPAVAIGAAVGIGFILARLAKAGAGYEASGRTGNATGEAPTTETTGSKRGSRSTATRTGASETGETVSDRETAASPTFPA